MAENAGVFYMDLPGMPVSGTFQQENVIILHKHRDVFIKIQTAFPKPLRVTCSGEPFYVPSLKKLVMQHNFAEGEEVGLWLKKSFSQDILIEQKTKDGWQRFLSWPVGAIDPNAYAELEECPAPISIVIKPLPESSLEGGGLEAFPQERFREGERDNDLFGRLPSRTTPVGGLPGPANDLPAGANGNPTASPTVSDNEGERAGERVYRLPQSPNPTDAGPGRRNDTLSEVYGQHAWLRNVFRDEELSLHAADEPCILLVEAEPGSLVEQAARSLQHGVAYWVGSDEDLAVSRMLFAVFQQAVEKRGFMRDLWGTQFRIQTTLIQGRPHTFVIFSGHAGLRSVVTGTRYGLLGGNRVTPITIGLGGLRGVGSSIGVGLESLGSRSGRAFLALALAADTAQWLATDGEDADKLVASWLTTLLGAVAIAVVAPLLATLIAGIVGVGTVASSTALLILGGVAVVLIAGWVVNEIFEWLGVKDFIYKYIREANEYYRKRAEEDPEFVMWYM